jgi:hypothetical protein
MKKNLLFTALSMLFMITVFGQSQRFVLFEEFTNASCGPCASQNPGFDALLNANAAKCTSIKYHTSWPGTDPMYNHNTTDVNARVSYYGVSGVPHAVMDGSAVPGSGYLGAPSNVTQSKIDAEYAIPSPFELTINQQLSPGADSIYVTMLGKATASVSGLLVAHCVVIEKHIHFNSAPGSNGEKDFYNVMKKMLPSASGTSLPSSFVAGDYFVLQFAWKLSNVYKVSELSVVGFIQDVQTKAVFQAANTTDTPISGVYQNDLELSGLNNVLPSYCEPSIAPKFQLRNNGSVPIASAGISYQLNDEPVQNYTYSGTLYFLDKAEITLPSTTFSIQGNNSLKIYGVTVNGVQDEYLKNDSISYSFPVSSMSGLQVTVLVKTDNSPGETTWDLKDIQGNIIATGGPYSQSAHTYSTNVDLGYATCYEFTIHDAGNNGVCCTNGIGFYKVSSSGTVLASGTSFGDAAVSQFYSPSNVGMPEPDAVSLKIYPNPVQDEAMLTFSNTARERVSVSVFNMQGAEVMQLPAQEYTGGEHAITLDCSALKTGTYNVRLTAGSKVFNQRISVVR